jgi:hypothetical protein
VQQNNPTYNNPHSQSICKKENTTTCNEFALDLPKTPSPAQTTVGKYTAKNRTKTCGNAEKLQPQLITTTYNRNHKQLSKHVKASQSNSSSDSIKKGLNDW